MKKIFESKIYKILMMIIKTVFFIIILLYLSFIIIQRINGNQSVFGYRLFTVATGSMAGVYDINDVIAVKDYDVNQLKVGDDIAYKGVKGGYEGLLITHRIIKIEDSEKGGKIIVTKGVNAMSEDPVITEKQVLGKVVGVVPIITQINHVVKNQLGFFLIVFTPLVIIIVLEVLETITEIRIEKNEIKRIEKESKEDDNYDSKKTDESEQIVEDDVDKKEDSLEEEKLIEDIKDKYDDKEDIEII